MPDRSASRRPQLGEVMGLSPLVGASVGGILGGVAVGWVLVAALLAWKRPAGVLGGGLMGLGLSLYLGKQHNPDAGESFCSAGDVFNCDVVNRSEWSEVGGVPVALIGAGFYAACAVAGFFWMRDPARHGRVPHLVTLGGGLSLLFSAFLAFQSYQLGSWCLFCIGLYGVNALLFTSGFLGMKGSTDSMAQAISAAIFGKDDRSSNVMLTAGIVTFVASMFWYRSLGGESTLPVNDAGKVDYSGLYEPVNGKLEIDGTEPILGDPAAPYTVVEFADFECPHCGKFAPMLDELVKKQPKVRVLFKHYPLSNLCNPAISSAFHENACGAARGAECARLQGKFWEMDKVMFMNQQFLAESDLLVMAEQVGLDVATFKTCLASPEADLAVRADADHGNKAGVDSTPSLFLSGIKPGGEFVRVKGDPEDALALINAHLAGTPLP
jgi:protein-disulfide isomerase/uncharacterized membrane protein